MRLGLAFIIVGVSWLLAMNAAANAETFLGFVGLLLVNVLCAFAFATLIEIDVRNHASND